MFSVRTAALSTLRRQVRSASATAEWLGTLKQGSGTMSVASKVTARGGGNSALRPLLNLGLDFWIWDAMLISGFEDRVW